MATPGVVWPLRRLRAMAGVVALLILVWMGAMSPHLVHHLADAGHEQTCLLSVQGSSCPTLMAAVPSLGPTQAVQGAPPAPPTTSPQVHLAVTGRPRAPPWSRP
jgi:hypothetical protein